MFESSTIVPTLRSFNRLPASALEAIAWHPMRAEIPLLSALRRSLTDRPLRPSFVDGLRNEIQVVVTVLAIAPDEYYDVLAINAASLSTPPAGLPFSGPIGGVPLPLLPAQRGPGRRECGPLPAAPPCGPGGACQRRRCSLPSHHRSRQRCVARARYARRRDGLT